MSRKEPIINSSRCEEASSMTERRRFMATAGGTMAAVTLAATVDAPYVIAQPKFQWRLSTAYPPTLDVVNGAALRLAKIVEETSGGRFRIEVFPGGQIMPPFACFDAASQGTIEAFIGTPQYWKAPWSAAADKEPAIEWFATIPFGMNPEGMAAWYPPGRRAQALGGDLRARSTSCRAPGRPLPRRWPDGSGRRSRRSATSRG